MAVEVHIIDLGELETPGFGKSKSIREAWENYPVLPHGMSPLDDSMKEVVRRAFYAGCADMFLMMGSVTDEKPSQETRVNLSKELIKFAEHVVSSERARRSLRTPKEEELHIGMEVCRPTDATKTGTIISITGDGVGTTYLVRWQTSPGIRVEAQHYLEELCVRT